jgi:ribosomal protein S18 acetylase RimI-like enzyme
VTGPRIEIHDATVSDHAVAAFRRGAAPDEPRWHLAMIGVEPRAQGSGHGGALLRHMLARCDRGRELACLLRRPR